MGLLGRAVVSFLLLMLFNEALIVAGRLYRYSLARSQSRAFVRDAATAFRGGEVDAVLAIAARNQQNHVASVVAAGVTAFAAAPPQFTLAAAIASAERAFQRSRQKVASDLKLGIGALTIIASTAPFIGLLGTVFGMLGAFRGVGMQKGAYVAMVNAYLSESLVTTAMGLDVAIPAVLFHNYFLERSETFDSEMSTAVLEAVTYLSVHPKWRARSESPDGLYANPASASRADLDPRPWEAPYDRRRALLIGAWFCQLCIFLTLALMVSSVFTSQSDASASYGLKYKERQELLSPDHRYRAIVPGFIRLGSRLVSCQTPEVALRILPNDRPLAWKPHQCNSGIKYALEPDEALLTWNCAVPVVMWRTNGDLLVQCDTCSADNLQVEHLDLFPYKITVLGADGKQINPQVVHPEFECYE
jgi:biopolymer transport protein ExbB/TolQ